MQCRHAGAMRLVYLVDNAELEGTQVAAAKELLNRGNGKATQPLAADAESGPYHIVISWKGRSSNT